MKQTKPQQRVAIARDVIKQLDAESIIATSGTYLEVHGMDPTDFFAEPPTVNKEILNSLDAPKCDVCAKGALFLASVRKFNQFNGPAPSSEGIAQQLTRTVPSFTVKQIDEIETVFEGYEGSKYPNANLFAFTDYVSDDERLRFICKYIVKNKGSIVGLRKAAHQHGLKVRNEAN